MAKQNKLRPLAKAVHREAADASAAEPEQSADSVAPETAVIVSESNVHQDVAAVQSASAPSYVVTGNGGAVKFRGKFYHPGERIEMPQDMAAALLDCHAIAGE